MSFLKLLENSKYFYFPAVVRVFTDERGVKKTTVRTGLKFPYRKENTDEAGNADIFSIFGFSNIDLKDDDLVRVEALKGLPFLIEKMGFVAQMAMS